MPTIALIETKLSTQIEDSTDKQQPALNSTTTKSTPFADVTSETIPSFQSFTLITSTPDIREQDSAMLYPTKNQSFSEEHNRNMTLEMMTLNTTVQTELDEPLSSGD